MKGGLIVKKEYSLLNDCRKNFVKNLSEHFEIDNNASDEVLRWLEAEDVVMIYPPEYSDKPATYFTKDPQLTRTGISMTSHKAGNIIINMYLNRNDLLLSATSVTMTIGGLITANLLLFIVGIISCVLNVSKLSDIKISENSAAIILALQKHSDYKMYSTSVQQCMTEANEILHLYGYKMMDELSFERELGILQKI